MELICQYVLNVEPVILMLWHDPPSKQKLELTVLRTGRRNLQYNKCVCVCIYIYIYIYIYICPSQWPHGIRRRSAAARLLRSWV
jgi:hypothetical protein